MSDTPRTDAETEYVEGTDRLFREGEPIEAVSAAFARKLERENAELRKAASDVIEGNNLFGHPSPADIRKLEAKLANK